MIAPPSRAQAVTQACAEAGLDPAFAGIVESLMDETDDRWRACCGSNCTPCSVTLAAAVDRAREILDPGPARAPDAPPDPSTG